jgi:hypothetical protein
MPCQLRHSLLPKSDGGPGVHQIGITRYTAVGQCPQRIPDRHHGINRRTATADGMNSTVPHQRTPLGLAVSNCGVLPLKAANSTDGPQDPVG